MKKQYLLFILLLIFPIFVNAGYCPTCGYNYFYKMDEEENIIDNAEFVIRDFNNDVKYDVSYDKNLKAYKYAEYVEQDYQKSLSLLLAKEKNIISNLNKKDDFIPYIITDNSEAVEQKEKSPNEMDVYCNWSPTSDSESVGLPKNAEIESAKLPDYCNVSVSTFMILEETKTPKGFEKEKAVIFPTVKIYYEFDNESGLVNNKMSMIQFSKGFIKYDDNINYSDLNIIESFTEEYIDSVLYDRVKCDIPVEFPTCPGPGCEQASLANGLAMSESHMREIKLSENDSNFEPECDTPIIVDKKGSSALSVNSYVNSKEEVNLTESSNVEIKVFLKNTGKAPSYENKVVSKVPEGVEYVAGSATDNGVYDEEKNTVTWDLDYLDASSGYIFSYEVAVTTGSKESVYVTTSSVSSEDNTTPIVSNEAKVTTPGVGGDAPEEEEEITNPKTGDDLNFALILGLLIGSIALISIKNRKPLGL